jgi:hypothetical protein
MLTSAEVLYPPVDPLLQPVADLDWTTGMIRMFMSSSEWMELLKTDSSELEGEQRYLLEAITHEATHVMQLVVTGYAYEFARSMAKVVAMAVNVHQTLAELLENTAEFTPVLTALFADLRLENEDGISPLALMESAAFYAQKFTHYRELTPEGYLAMLDAEAPAGEYRIAYDFAADALGGDAFGYFVHIVNLSLCAERPAQAFPILVDLFKRSASRSDVQANHDKAWRLLREKFGDAEIASGAELHAAGRVHPILARTIEAYGKLVADGEMEAVTLFCAPVINANLAGPLLGPVMFPPDASSRGTVPMWVPPTWLESYGDNELLNPQQMRFLCAASQVIQQGLDPLEPAPILHRVTPAPEERLDFTAGLRPIETPREHRTPETARNLARMIGDLTADPLAARALRGRLALTFPSSEFPGDDSPLADPGVQRFLRECFDLAPPLFYFLADAPGLGALLTAVAAYAPDSLEFSTQGIGARPDDEVFATVVKVLRPAAEAARGFGQPPSIVLGHLNAFGSEETQAQLVELVLAT